MKGVREGVMWMAGERMASQCKGPEVQPPRFIHVTARKPVCLEQNQQRRESG